MSYFSNLLSSKPINFVSKVKKTVAKVEKFANKFEAKVAHVATDLAYKLAQGNKIYKEHESKTIESLEKNGWKTLCNSSEFADTNQNGYKAVAFINAEAKQVLIATAGTVPTDLHDLKDDAYIAAGSFPSKITQVKAMIDHITTLLATDASNYVFNVAGHSLGAVLTDATAFEIMSKGLELGTSITFDSPGSKNAIDQAIKAGVFSKTVDVTVENLAEHCVVYNAKHNIINCNPIISSPHITAPKLVLSLEQQVATDAPVQYVEKESSGIIGYVSYLVSKTSSNIIKSCADYLGITRTVNELENLKGHSLKNFADLCEKPVVDTLGWERGIDNGLLIEDFDGSSCVHSTGNDLRVVKEYDVDDDTVEISLNEFNFADLQRAHDNINKAVPTLGTDPEFPSMEFIN
ncbi:hypothetical protein [Rickettsia amblyommatis]|uniref:hypothetical protein n=1 Tax=Rickettsia amblyommatis TaxID=33989 RepID=UPI0006A76D27|nr:hypothetical protein [Rickettsia amblyommatis]ALA61342.1 hypothetical protein AL573_00770 [Rickettsia amblyommatis]